MALTALHQEVIDAEVISVEEEHETNKREDEDSATGISDGSEDIEREAQRRRPEMLVDKKPNFSLYFRVVEDFVRSFDGGGTYPVER